MGQEQILVSKFKFCVLAFGKHTFLLKELIHLSLCTTLNLAITSNQGHL